MPQMRLSPTLKYSDIPVMSHTSKGIDQGVKVFRFGERRILRNVLNKSALPSSMCPLRLAHLHDRRLPAGLRPPLHILLHLRLARCVPRQRVAVPLLRIRAELGQLRVRPPENRVDLRLTIRPDWYSANFDEHGGRHTPGGGGVRGGGARLGFLFDEAGISGPGRMRLPILAKSVLLEGRIRPDFGRPPLRTLALLFRPPSATSRGSDPLQSWPVI